MSLFFVVKQVHQSVLLQYKQLLKQESKESLTKIEIQLILNNAFTFIKAPPLKDEGISEFPRRE